MKISVREEESSHVLMEIKLIANGLMIRRMGLVLFSMIMEIVLKVNSEMTKMMASVLFI